jgi:hypothetical protein
MRDFNCTFGIINPVIYNSLVVAVYGFLYCLSLAHFNTRNVLDMDTNFPAYCEGELGIISVTFLVYVTGFRNKTMLENHFDVSSKYHQF